MRARFESRPGARYFVPDWDGPLVNDSVSSVAYVLIGQVTSASGTGRVRLCGHVKRSSLNSAGYLEFPDGTVRGQDLRNKVCLARVLISQIRPCRRFGLS